jgi:hypothetical protein
LYRTQTQAAADALLRLNPPDEPMAPIPAAAYNIGAALLAQEQGVAVGGWVTVKASRLGGDIAVSIEPSTVNDHVKAILAKTGSRNRPMLLSRALGAASSTNGPSDASVNLSE